MFIGDYITSETVLFLFLHSSALMRGDEASQLPFMCSSIDTYYKQGEIETDMIDHCLLIRMKTSALINYLFLDVFSENVHQR